MALACRRIDPREGVHVEAESAGVPPRHVCAVDSGRDVLLVVAEHVCGRRPPFRLHVRERHFACDVLEQPVVLLGSQHLAQAAVPDLVLDRVVQSFGVAQPRGEASMLRWHDGSLPGMFESSVTAAATEPPVNAP